VRFKFFERIGVSKLSGPLLGTFDISFYCDEHTPVSAEPIVQTESLGFSEETYAEVLVDDVLHRGKTGFVALETVIELWRRETVQLLCALIGRGHGRLSTQADSIGRIN